MHSAYQIVDDIVRTVQNIPLSDQSLFGIVAVFMLVFFIVLYRVAHFLLPAAIDYAWRQVEEVKANTENRYWGKVRRLGFTKKTLWILGFTIVLFMITVAAAEVVMEKSVTKALLFQLVALPLILMTGMATAYASLDKERREQFEISRFFGAFLRPALGAFVLMYIEHFLKFASKYAFASIL